MTLRAWPSPPKEGGSVPEGMAAPASSTAHRSQPRWLNAAFLFFALYLVLPLFDIPLLALSLSAPIFFVIAVPAVLRPRVAWFGAYRRWIVMAAAIWIGIFISAILNGLLSQGTDIDRDGLVSLIQFAYWLLVFVVTTYLVSSQRLGRRVAVVSAVGIAILATMRWGEAIFGGSIGAWMHLVIMTQNSYAILFSTFGTVLLSFVFIRRTSLVTALAVVVLWGAVLVNGSRGGWLSVLAATLVFVWMFAITQPRGIRAFAVASFLMASLGMGALLAPQNMVRSFTDRADTLQTLDEDKSYAIRVLMNQKGIRLFRASPWIGVGVSRWRKESIPLDIPQILQYQSQSYFDRKSSHNSYVAFLAENGLVGAVPLGVLLITLIAQGYRATYGLAKRGEVWAIGIYAGFVGMSVHLVVLAGLTGTVTWFMYGLVAAMIELHQKATILE